MAILIIDIETIPGPNMPDIMDIKAPANYKDPEKIKAYQIENQLDQYKKQALDSMKGQIICIGWCVDDSEIITKCGDEHFALTSLYSELSSLAYDRITVTWSGWNIDTFDIPWLWRKAVRYNIQGLRQMIPKDNRHMTIDLMRVWAAEYHDYTKLADCAAFLNIDHDGSSGSEIYDLWKKGDFKGIESHCRQDLITTREIYKRLVD